MKTTNFERAIFFSWYCGIADCKFCYMSTTRQHNKGKIARRTTESILAELYLCKKLKWDIGFLSGGQKAYTTVEFLELLKKINKTINEKIWINVGPLNKEEVVQFKPYIKGVVASIETINPKLHSELCPSKPIEPFVRMFSYCDELKLKKAVTIIIGLGETLDDYNLLGEFIIKNKIDKIHVYSLNPQKETVFESKKSPSVEYHANWIRNLRKDFPKLDIQAGIWKDKVGNVRELLKAGANSISKFPAIKLYGTEYAKEIEEQAKKAGFKFKGRLYGKIKIDYNEINKLNFDEKLKDKVKIKLEKYIEKMNKNLKNKMVSKYE